jgi:hypothetical protein
MQRALLAMFPSKLARLGDRGTSAQYCNGIDDTKRSLLAQGLDRWWLWHVTCVDLPKCGSNCTGLQDASIFDIQNIK